MRAPVIFVPLAMGSDDQMRSAVDQENLSIFWLDCRLSQSRIRRANLLDRKLIILSIDPHVLDITEQEIDPPWLRLGI